jgi:hypothetical protein
MHKEAMPRFSPLCFSAPINVVVNMRAPDAPIGMAQRGCAAVDVDLVVRDAQVAHREHRDAGEGLVDFEQVNIADAPPGLVEHLG